LESVAAAGGILSKEDLAFERKMRWGRLVKFLLVLPLAAALAIAIYWYGFRQGKVYTPVEEIEPNNMPEDATPIFPGKRISGHIGQRMSSTESDRDWYKIKIEGKGPQALQARVSGIPNMDITLELFDASAGRITGSDSMGRGGGEIITNWVVDPGSYFFLIREVWLVGTAPTENVTDAYHLLATVQPYEAGWEMEPNDSPEKASAIAAGSTFRGYLGAATDVDFIKVESAAGTLAGLVSGIDGVDLVLEVTPSKAERAIAFDEEGLSSGERFDGVKADGKTAVLIQIRRKNTEKGQTNQEQQGLDIPYTLKTWLKPAR
jgi:hypothetical protein